MDVMPGVKLGIIGQRQKYAYYYPYLSADDGQNMNVYVYFSNKVLPDENGNLGVSLSRSEFIPSS
jgi:hypothetical protein